MIEKIAFQNYKLFKERQELELKPLTILIGKNSSGKSSITKLLPLLENSINGDLEDNQPLSLNNQGVELGSEFKDLVYGKYEVGVLDFELRKSSAVYSNCIGNENKRPSQNYTIETIGSK